MTLVDRIIECIGATKALDAPAKQLKVLTKPLLREGSITDALSGKQLGHPLHPALIAVPIGAFLSASIVDAMRSPGANKPAERLIVAGLLSAVPTAMAGLSDWRYTSGAEKRVGLVHATVNIAALATYGASLVARKRGRTAAGKMLALAGSGLLGLGGSIGGHLSYALGVGVDTNAFGELPTKWKPVADESKISEASMLPVDVDGSRVLITKAEDGEIYAIGNRCSHRGGPLSDGKRKGDCVECPWHASVFDIKTGAVVQGPAVRPQPKFDTRVRDGQVEIRRSEFHASLSTNSDSAHH